MIVNFAILFVLLIVLFLSDPQIFGGLFNNFLDQFPNLSFLSEFLIFVNQQSQGLIVLIFTQTLIALIHVKYNLRLNREQFEYFRELVGLLDVNKDAARAFGRNLAAGKLIQSQSGSFKKAPPKSLADQFSYPYYQVELLLEVNKTKNGISYLPQITFMKDQNFVTYASTDEPRLYAYIRSSKFIDFYGDNRNLSKLQEIQAVGKDGSLSVCRVNSLSIGDIPPSDVRALIPSLLNKSANISIEKHQPEFRDGDTVRFNVRHAYSFPRAKGFVYYEFDRATHISRVTVQHSGFSVSERASMRLIPPNFPGLTTAVSNQDYTRKSFSSFAVDEWISAGCMFILAWDKNEIE